MKHSRLRSVLLSFTRRNTKTDAVTVSGAYYTTVSDRLSLVQMLLYLLLLVFLAVTILGGAVTVTYNNIYYFFSDVAASVDLHSSVTSDDVLYYLGEDTQFVPFRSGFAAAGDDAFAVYTETGRRTYYEKIDGYAPILSVSDKYVAVRVQNGKRVSLYHAGARIFQNDFEYTVNTVAVSDHGEFAVVTEGGEYPAKMEVYDANAARVNTLTFRSLVSAICFDPDGTRLAYATEADGNVTDVRILTVGTETATDSVSVPGRCYTVIFEDSDCLLCLTNRGIYRVCSAEVTEVVPFENVFLLRFATDGEQMCVLVGGVDGTRKLISVSGYSVTEFAVSDANVTDVNVSNGSIFLLYPNLAECISDSGTRYVVDIDMNAISICPLSDGSAYVCGSTRAVHISNWGRSE